MFSCYCPFCQAMLKRRNPIELYTCNLCGSRDCLHHRNSRFSQNPYPLKDDHLRREMHQQIVNLRKELNYSVNQLAEAIYIVGAGLQQYDKLFKTRYWTNLRHHGTRRPNIRVLRRSIRNWEKGRLLPNWETLVLLKIIADTFQIPLDVPEKATPDRYGVRWKIIQSGNIVAPSNYDDTYKFLLDIWKLGR